MPGAGHVVHMPSHIYYRSARSPLGEGQRAGRPVDERTSPPAGQGFYPPLLRHTSTSCGPPRDGGPLPGRPRRRARAGEGGGCAELAKQMSIAELYNFTRWSRCCGSASTARCWPSRADAMLTLDTGDVALRPGLRPRQSRCTAGRQGRPAPGWRPAEGKFARYDLQRSRSADDACLGLRDGGSRASPATWPARWPTSGSQALENTLPYTGPLLAPPRRPLLGAACWKPASPPSRSRLPRHLKFHTAATAGP